MQKRDPGRTFVLGERLSYVLLPGMRTQDEGAEDPLAAAKGGLAADYELYWHNKLRRPLSEILTTCLTAAQLQVGECVLHHAMKDLEIAMYALHESHFVDGLSYNADSAESGRLRLTDNVQLLHSIMCRRLTAALDCFEPSAETLTWSSPQKHGLISDK